MEKLEHQLMTAFEKDTSQLPKCRPRSRNGEGFSDAGRGGRCALAQARPALEKPPKVGSRGGLGSVYGESVQSVGATVASGVRLKVRMLPDTLACTAEDANKAVCFGVIAASCDAWK